MRVDLHFLTPLQPTKNDDPAVLAETSQRSVEAVFHPVKNPEGPHVHEPSVL
ncbi:MAG: hypothetical protein HC902_06265 [Calothrix sp. SM1_5_4]|nr:hypothetical protein [Calothrix sp. SM1_5_4]